MRFEMDSSGAVFFNGEKLALPETEREISQAIASHPNLAVILSIDGKAPWQQVVYFVELAQKLKVDSFSFNMRQEQ
jgi:biopolymer transport protein ExbD